MNVPFINELNNWIQFLQSQLNSKWLLIHELNLLLGAEPFIKSSCSVLMCVVLCAPCLNADVCFWWWGIASCSPLASFILLMLPCISISFLFALPTASWDAIVLSTWFSDIEKSVVFYFSVLRREDLSNTQEVVGSRSDPADQKDTVRLTSVFISPLFSGHQPWSHCIE